MTDGIHTGELESIHSLYTKYVPKRKKLSQEGLNARLHLAAIDHNSSVHRQQATTKSGKLRFKVQYCKGAMAYVAKPNRAAKRHEYRHELLTGVLDQCEKEPSFRKLLKAEVTTKETIVGEHHGAQKPDNETVFENSLSRFKKNYQILLVLRSSDNISC